ncbi:unnamed protein product [Phytophthora fragariaefolia]|uniref:Unnamed protein product n=1 Tax=Phytophthora fragariaefolia TaxID=1490495 RepID=A0A9W6X9A5_9STRA|nr:unnamed protein product [Phytophthora fragariaefolia]
MVVAENEAAHNALVLGLATPLHMPAATQASVASPASVPDPAESALPDSANPLLEPAFTAPGAQEAWCEILNARIPQPIASDRVTEGSIAGIQAFADWEDPPHTWQRLRSRLPESPCTFGADDFMRQADFDPGSGLAIVMKLWRQFTWRAVGRTDHSDLGFAAGNVPTGFRSLLSSNGSSSSLTGSGPTRPNASGKIKCPPEILSEPSMLQYSFEPLTWAPGTAVWTAKVVDLDARQPWRNRWVGLPADPSSLRRGVHEFSDARAQAAADASAAADSPSDASSTRTPIPAADQANVQAELRATAPAQARLDVLADLATTAEI